MAFKSCPNVQQLINRYGLIFPVFVHGLISRFLLSTTQGLGCGLNDIRHWKGGSRIFQGGRGRLVPCVVESKGHAPKMWQFGNWNLIENCCTRNTSNVMAVLARKRVTCNYKEVPVQCVCLYFCHSMNNLFHFFKLLLLQKGVASHPIQPLYFIIKLKTFIHTSTPWYWVVTPSTLRWVSIYCHLEVL